MDAGIAIRPATTADAAAVAAIYGWYVEHTVVTFEVDPVSAAGYRHLVGAIALPNEASVRLHERLGFQKAGHLVRIGYKLGRWVDVGNWQLEHPQTR